MEETFTHIYEKKLWGNNGISEYNGSSGPGSYLINVKDNYIPFLKNFITSNNIKEVTDLGCGDFICGKLIYDDLDVKYTGYDVYKKVVNYNSSIYSLPKYSFTHLDFCNKKEEIVSGELCIIKDVLMHWPLEYIYSLLDYLVENKKFKYILLCNCGNQSQDDVNIYIGHWRALSCDYLPLKKYNAKKIYTYSSKEVSLIKIE